MPLGPKKDACGPPQSQGCTWATFLHCCTISVKTCHEEIASQHTPCIVRLDAQHHLNVGPKCLGLVLGPFHHPRRSFQTEPDLLPLRPIPATCLKRSAEPLRGSVVSRAFVVRGSLRSHPFWLDVAQVAGERRSKRSKGSPKRSAKWATRSWDSPVLKGAAYFAALMMFCWAQTH